MPFVADTTTTTGQIRNSTNRVKVVEFHARSSNTSSVYIGNSDVTAEKGRELAPDGTFKLNFDEGSVPLSDFYAHVSGSDKIDWVVIYEDK